MKRSRLGIERVDGFGVGFGFTNAPFRVTFVLLLGPWAITMGFGRNMDDLSEEYLH